MSAAEENGMSPATVRVKEEREWDGVSEADLYMKNEVKCELVLGPELLQPQDVAYANGQPLNATDTLKLKLETKHCSAADLPGAPQSDESCSEHLALRTGFVKLEPVSVDSELHTCMICHETFLEKFRLETHMCTRSEKGTSNIVKCNKAFGVGEQKHKYSCDTCGKWFTTRCGIVVHLQTHIWEKPVCNKRFMQSCNLLADKRSRTHEKRFSCDICNKSFAARSSMRRHLQIHMGEKKNTYPCGICHKRFGYKHYLTVHKRIHTGEKPYSCKICKKRCKDSPGIANHMKTHLDEKPFSCELCKKSFSYKGSLVRHVQIHIEKPYTCEICKKPFRYTLSLARHERIHRGEKPYSCEICTKQFSCLSKFTTHEQVHTGEKPYTCEICNKRFGQNSLLAKHKLIHTGEKPFSCDICKKQFTQSCNLDKHKKVHLTDKPVSCESCEEQLTQKSYVFHLCKSIKPVAVKTYVARHRIKQ